GRTKIKRHRRLPGRDRLHIEPLRRFQVPRRRQGRVLDVGQQVDEKSAARIATARRQRTVGVVVVVDRQAELFEVILATQPRRRLPHLLHRRQQQADQGRDNGNDDKEFDQRERQTAGDAVEEHRTLGSVIWLFWAN